MLHYTEFGLSYMEVPKESALCIYISGCQNRCIGCHYPELQETNYGELLSDYFEQMLDLYHEYITCVCFMGEGENSEDSRMELLRYVHISHCRGYRCCLYSGRDTVLEEWMQSFDYVKLGSYKTEYGALTSKTTNQRMLKQVSEGEFKDITNMFWEDE